MNDQPTNQPHNPDRHTLGDHIVRSLEQILERGQGV